MTRGLTFNFKPIAGNPQFNLAGISKALRAAALAEGADHRMLMEKTVKTWARKPKFESKITVHGNALTLTSAPIGDEAEIWWYLEQGTKLRWAVMSSPFAPKTRRAWLGSSKGKGGAVIAGKRAMLKRGIRARPGIKARNWIAEINKQRSRKFKGLMQRVFSLLAKNTITPHSLRKS